MWDILLRDCHAATMAGGEPYGAIRDAAIAIENGRIAWIGAARDCPRGEARQVRRLDGAWVTPGLIDCHTHLVFGGNRAHEWEMRRQGATYEAIAQAGGGILSTVRRHSRRKRRPSCRDGVPARAGDDAAGRHHRRDQIGLRPRPGKRNEDAACRCAHRRARCCPRVAQFPWHARPAGGIQARPQGLYGPDLRHDDPGHRHGRLADSVDAFCETIAFTPDEAGRVFAAAQAHGLTVKLHAEQLSDCGGAALAAKHGALSADHLEHLSESGIAAMAQAGTIAVLLPAAFYFLREMRKPPVAALRRAGVPIAIATDCNPGTSPVVAPLIVLNMACTLFDLTPEEALAGMTRQAARALGLEGEIGTLEAGKSADLAVWHISEPAELAYWIGADLLADRYFQGRSDKEKPA